MMNELKSFAMTAVVFVIFVTAGVLADIYIF